MREGLIVVHKCAVCRQTVRADFLPIFHGPVVPEGVDDGHYDVCSGCGQGVPGDEDEAYQRRHTIRLARRRLDLATEKPPAVFIPQPPRRFDPEHETNLGRSDREERQDPSKPVARGRR